jgi:hypothetical protein
MPRKRTPSPEQLHYDKQIIEASAVILGAVGARHSNEKLRLAAELCDSFVGAPVPTPKPRTRKPKLAAAPEPPTLAHQSV